MDEDRENDRREGRQRTLLAACLVIPDGFLTIPCSVTDVSAKGARLKLPAAQAIPDDVILITSRKPYAYWSEVAWRDLPEIGVRFFDFVDLTAPKTTDERILRRIWLEMAAR